ncbi:hypothetical protein [Streptomyces pilosus]|uniref:hypothetical protein n=1 Tax=Streptomyces pilosus TaxID=28893 RepID=UPI00363B65F9
MDDAALVALKQWQAFPTMPKAYVRSRSERRYRVREQVWARAVEAYGMTPASGGIACDIHVDFHDQLPVDETDVQDVMASPPGCERAPRPRVLARGRYQPFRE